MIYTTKKKETSNIPGVVFGFGVYAIFIVAVAHTLVGSI
jgi:hypothetical protein